MYALSLFGTAVALFCIPFISDPLPCFDSNDIIWDWLGSNDWEFLTPWFQNCTSRTKRVYIWGF